MHVVSDFRAWLTEELDELPLTSAGKVYVVSVLVSAEDLSSKILSLELLEAKLHRDVSRLMKVGDWGVYRGTLDPAALHADGNFLSNISKAAYLEAVEATRGQLSVLREIANKIDEVAMCAHAIVLRRGPVVLPKVNSRPAWVLQ